MTLGEKIKRLREERGWTQDFLGEKIDVHGRHVSRYENNKTRPSMKTLKRIAEVFTTTVDDLTWDGSGTLPPFTIEDPELFQQFREVQRFEEQDKVAIKRLLDAMIKKNQLEGILQKR